MLLVGCVQKAAPAAEVAAVPDASATVPTPPAPPNTPPSEAETVAPGVRSVRLKPGTGTKPSRPGYLAFDFTCTLPEATAQPGHGAIHQGRPETCLYLGGNALETALAVMEDGEQRRFWVPSSRGEFMIDVTMPARPAMPANLIASAEAVTLASGVRYRVLEGGTGAPATAQSTVQLLLTGWTPDGRQFDARDDQKDPVVVNLKQEGGVYAALVGDMRVGERRRVWIASSANFTPFNRGIETDQIVDLTLLRLGFLKPGRKAPGLSPATGCNPACAVGEVCVSHAVQCIRAPCPPVLECVLDE